MSTKINPDKQIPFFGVADSFDIAYRKNQNTYPVHPHVHNALEVYFTLTDLPDALLGSIITNVPAGTLIFIPPYMVHQLYHEPEPVYERYVLSIDPVWLESSLRNCPTAFPYLDSNSDAGIIPLRTEEQELLVSILNEILALNEPYSPAYYARFFFLYEQMERIVSDYRTRNNLSAAISSKAQNTVTGIIRYINEILLQNPRVADIADHFYMNKDYLERLFKKETHITIGQYIALQKISLAQQYFRKGLTVTQTGELLGFCNYSHFLHFYKKVPVALSTPLPLIHEGWGFFFALLYRIILL